MNGQTLSACAKCLVLELPFIEHCWPLGPEYDVFKVSGEIFMLVTELHRRPFINLKPDPQKSLLNQQVYPSIEPNYHMDKKHWVSVYPGDDITESLLVELTSDSQHRVIDGLPKRDRRYLRPG